MDGCCSFFDTDTDTDTDTDSWRFAAGVHGGRLWLVQELAE
jgi:hypothetical protein